MVSSLSVLEWVAFPFSRGSSQPRDWTQVSRIAGRFFTSWATREASLNPTTPYSKLLLHCPAQSLQTTLSSLTFHLAPWPWPEFGRSLFFFPVDLVLLLQRQGSHGRGGRGAKGKDRLLGVCWLSPDDSTLSARSSMFYSLCSFLIWRWQPLPTATDLQESTSSHLPPALLTPPNKLAISQSTPFAFLIRWGEPKSFICLDKDQCEWNPSTGFSILGFWIPLYWDQKTQSTDLPRKRRRLEFGDVHQTNQVGSQCFFWDTLGLRLVYPEKLPEVRVLY